MVRSDWKKVSVVIGDNGEKTITYNNSKYPGVDIQSRKRNIPHAGGKPGSWSFTDYVVIRDDCEKVYYSLRATIAKVEEE